MLAVARYLLAEHLRSRRWVGPRLLLAGGVVALYAQPPNPVLPTAETAAAFLFAGQSRLALAFLNTQGAADRQIFAATAGGRTFVRGRIAGLAGLALLGSVATLGYPTLAGSFDRERFSSRRWKARSTNTISSSLIVHRTSGCLRSMPSAQPARSWSSSR